MIAAISIVAEQRIREAMERGEFENLPSRGRPLDLDEDANVPEELRMAYKLLKNGGYLGEASLKEGPPSSLDNLMRHCPDERFKLRQMLKLNVVESRFVREAGRKPGLDAVEAYRDKVVDRMPVIAKGGMS